MILELVHRKRSASTLRLQRIHITTHAVSIYGMDLLVHVVMVW